MINLAAHLPIFEELAAAGRFLAHQGWSPATSSNYSALSGEFIAITKTGRDKYNLSADDIMLIDSSGYAVAPEGARSSAETLIHLMIYQERGAGAVLHTHSLAGTLLSMEEKDLSFSGLEILKGLSGNTTHEMEEHLPVLPNSQNMEEFCQELRPHLQKNIHGFLMAGHGLYTWGKNIAETKRHIETFEFLLNCEMEKRRWKK